MLSTPATGSQEEKVPPKGRNAREVRKETLKAYSTSDPTKRKTKNLINLTTDLKIVEMLLGQSG